MARGDGFSLRCGPWFDIEVGGYRLPNPKRHPEDEGAWSNRTIPTRDERERLEAALAEYRRLKSEERLNRIAMHGKTGVRDFEDWALKRLGMS